MLQIKQNRGAGMYENIAISLDRADELLKDMRAEYEKSLNEKAVSGRAIQLTHEVCSLLRAVLDRIAWRYWELRVSPSVAQTNERNPQIYFPVASNQQSLDSTLGKWRWKEVREQHQQIYEYLLGLQPFTSSKNKWLTILSDLANTGKHIDLIPQTKTEQRETKVSHGGGSISWTSGVVFTGGVHIMGAPIDAQTQQIVPTPGVTQTVEIWVDFKIDGHNVSALRFCEEACQNVRQIVSEMTSQFDLA